MGWGSVAVSGVIRQVIISDMMGGAGKPRMGEKERGGEGMWVQGLRRKVDRVAISPHQRHQKLPQLPTNESTVSPITIKSV